MSTTSRETLFPLWVFFFFCNFDRGRRFGFSGWKCIGIAILEFGKRLTDMITHFGLIYSKHQSIEYGRREIIVINLVAFMRRLLTI